MAKRKLNISIGKRKEGKSKSDLPLWRKITGGFLRYDRKRPKLKPNETIRMSYDEVKNYGIYGHLKLVEGDSVEFEKISKSVDAAKDAAKGDKKEDIQLFHRGAGWYDVVLVETNGEKIKTYNEKALKSAEANELLKQLQG